MKKTNENVFTAREVRGFRKETNTNYEETVQMEKKSILESFANIYNETIAYAKQSYARIKDSERLNETVLTASKYAGKAYRKTKEVVKNHWSKVALAVGTMFAAGAFTTGIGPTIAASSFAYAGIKTLKQYLDMKKSGEKFSLLDCIVESSKHLIVGLLLSYSVYCTVVYAGYYMIVLALNVLNLSIQTWATLSLFLLG